MNTKFLPPDEDGPTNPEPQEANGLPQHRAATELAQTTLLLASEQESSISEDQTGTLAIIFDPAQPRGSWTERRADRERRINEDASFEPLRAPHKRPDGKYARPRGRAPEGMNWDSERGVYVPRKGGSHAKPRKQKHNSSGRRASDGDIAGANSGNPYARPRLPSFGTSARAASRERRSSYADMPSSTGSFATSVSETDPHNGKRKRTRSRGSGRESSVGEGESDGKNVERIVVIQGKDGTPRFINECATILARVDEEAHQRALVQDATSILEGFLFPMSFPWNHSIVPAIRNFPKDIDELPSIAHADDDEFTPFENGVFGYGGFEVGKERRPAASPDEDKESDEFHAATRRSDDVGVIELTVIDHKSATNESSRLWKKKSIMLGTGDGSMNNVSTSPSAFLHEPELAAKSDIISDGGKANAATVSDHGKNGKNDQGVKVDAEESIFHCFQQTQSIKKQKLSLAKESTQRLLVSVRFGSVSSRTSVLHESHTGKDNANSAPLLSEAILPSRRPRHATISKVTNPESDTSEVEANQLKRDHLLWTHANSGDYLSTLTGSNVLVTSCKKPREVRVGVRLNSCLLSYQPGDAWSPQSVRDNIFAVDERFVKAAVDRACSGSSRPRQVNASMCMLDCDQLMGKVKVPQPHRIVNARKLPRLDCVPLALNSAAIRVVCICPGKMKSTCVRQLFRSAKGRMCSVCWIEDDAVKQCFKCGVLAHTTCCAHGGMMVPPNKMDATNTSNAYDWMCAVCCESPNAPGPPRRRVTNLPLRYQSNMLLEMDLHQTSNREESLKCSLCPHSGGAMSPVGDDMRWAHEVCRIWTRKQAEPESIMPKTMGLCALCGSEDNGALIKCAGSGCTVRFHPMCALITVVDDDEKNGTVPEESNSNRRDERLCSRFTLDVLQCGKSLIPVGFCGFHNPMRDETLCGCYPGGIGAAMRVPAYRNGKP